MIRYRCRLSRPNLQRPWAFHRVTVAHTDCPKQTFAGADAAGHVRMDGSRLGIA